MEWSGVYIIVGTLSAPPEEPGNVIHTICCWPALARMEPSEVDVCQEPSGPQWSPVVLWNYSEDPVSTVGEQAVNQLPKDVEIFW